MTRKPSRPSHADDMRTLASHVPANSFERHLNAIAATVSMRIPPDITPAMAAAIRRLTTADIDGGRVTIRAKLRAQGLTAQAASRASEAATHHVISYRESEDYRRAYKELLHGQDCLGSVDPRVCHYGRHA